MTEFASQLKMMGIISNDNSQWRIQGGAGGGEATPLSPCA